MSYSFHVMTVLHVKLLQPMSKAEKGKDSGDQKPLPAEKAPPVWQSVLVNPTKTVILYINHFIFSQLLMLSYVWNFVMRVHVCVCLHVCMVCVCLYVCICMQAQVHIKAIHSHSVFHTSIKHQLTYLLHTSILFSLTLQPKPFVGNCRLVHASHSNPSSYICSVNIKPG